MYKNIKWCCETQVKPLYNDIKYKDYFTPYERLINNQIISNKKDVKINDDYMHYYIKSQTNISIIIVYPNALNQNGNVNLLKEELKKNGDIHYEKDLEITYLMGYNLLYQLYAEEERMKKNSHIIYKLDRVGFKNDGSQSKIKVIVYTLLNNIKKINGKSAEYKMELRNIFLEEDIKKTKFKSDDDRYPRGYDYLHISDNANQSYEYASIFFHKNSLHFLEKQKSWRMLEMNKSINLFNKLKKIIYMYSQQEVEKLLIFSSGVLFSYGIREMNDIDCLLLPSDQVNPKDIDKLNDNDLDISYKGTIQFNSEWEEELNNRAKILGSTDYYELVMNPENYYYFMGLKIIRLKHEIKLRYQRKRPAQMTDLLVIRQMFNLNYQLEIPNETTEYGKDPKVVNKNTYLETMKFYLNKRYYIDIKVKDVEDWLNMNFTNDVELLGGTNENLYKLDNISENKIVYPSQVELLKMGYSPNVIIYSSDKPYLYPGENFDFDIVNYKCNKNSNDIKSKKNELRVCTFNLHNFISRCNQGIAPLFGTVLNPFEKARDIKKFINLFSEINADVICLQELVPITKKEIDKDIKDLDYIQKNFNFEYFNELMETIGYKYRLIGSTQQGKFYDTEQRDYYFLANGIYSKIKFEETEIYGFKYLNRNILTATIKFNNKLVQIYNTHLEYFSTTNQNLLNNQIDQQFIDLRNLIENTDTPTKIVCGDFNINLYNKLNTFRYKNWENRTKYFRDNFINTNRTKISTNFHVNDQTDMILINNNSKIRSVYSHVNFTNISDHYLYFVDFV